MARLPLVVFKGLQPAIDRRRISEPYVIDGANFLVDVDGPNSAFARTNLMYKELLDPLYVQSFRLSDSLGVFFFTSGAVLKYDQTANALIPVHTFTQPSSVFPWSHAIVGGLHYFARRGINLIQFNPFTGSWRQVTGADVPASIYSVTQSAGRLIALAVGLVAWTAIDDGTDFTTSTVTGAGFQTLSIINATDVKSPLAVKEYAGGFLTYTTEGILRSQAISGINPFRHRPLSRKHFAINPFVIAEINELEHVFLTEAGFFSTKGEVPQIWEPLFSEFLHASLIPSLDIAKDAIFKLTENLERGWVILSVASNETSGLYNIAYIFYRQSKQWGKFNRTHTGFLNLEFANAADVGSHSGYVDSEGTIFEFIPAGFDSIFPDNAANIFIYEYNKNVEYPARDELGTYKMPSRLHLVTQDESIFTNSVVYNTRTVIDESKSPDPIVTAEIDAENNFPSGVSKMKSSMVLAAGVQKIVIAQAVVNAQSLDAYILVGLIRASQDIDIDELTRLTALQIGMLDTAVGDTIVDWQNDFADDIVVDWAAIPEIIVEWGGSVATSTDYDVRVFGTLDGVHTWEGMDQVPTLVLQENRYRQYACDITGLYLLIRIAAETAGKNFALKTLELDGHAAGRLF